jgi:hypothetical protein
MKAVRVGISRSRLMDMMLRRRSLKADEIEELIEEITRLKQINSKAISLVKRAESLDSPRGRERLLLMLQGW